VMPQCRFADDLPCRGSGGFDFAHPRRRPEMITNAVCPAEPRRGDDLFVVNALAAIAALTAMGDVPLGRQRTEFEIARHTINSWLRLARLPGRGVGRAKRKRGRVPPPDSAPCPVARLSIPPR